MKELSIRLTWQTAQKRAVLATVVLGVAETSYDAASLAAALMQDCIQIERLAKTGLVSVIEELSEEVRKGGKPALLLTKAGEAALCLANRHRGVRAVAVSDVSTARTSVAAVGANFLVLDPERKSVSVINRIVRDFLAAPKECPADFAAVLG